MGTADELKKLIAMRDSGDISAEEFETLKARLLGPKIGAPNTDTAEVPKKKPRGCLSVGCMGLVVVFMIVIIAAISGNKADPSADSNADTSAPASQSAESGSVSSESESPSPAPESVDTPEQLREALVAELGEFTNMDVPRDIQVELTSDKETFIQLVMSDNFNNKMARGYAWQEIAKALLITRDSTFAKDMTITFTTELFDKSGKSLGQTNVLTVWFDESAFADVVPENLVGEDMWSGAATSVFIHPAIRD